jgi:hypothetical protein
MQCSRRQKESFDQRVKSKLWSSLRTINISKGKPIGDARVLARDFKGRLPSFPHPFGVRINHLLTILRRFPGVSIDLRVQGSVIAVK